MKEVRLSYPEEGSGEPDAVLGQSWTLSILHDVFIEIVVTCLFVGRSCIFCCPGRSSRSCAALISQGDKHVSAIASSKSSDNSHVSPPTNKNKWAAFLTHHFTVIIKVTLMRNPTPEVGANVELRFPECDPATVCDALLRSYSRHLAWPVR